MIRATLSGPPQLVPPAPRVPPQRLPPLPPFLPVAMDLHPAPRRHLAGLATLGHARFLKSSLVRALRAVKRPALSPSTRVSDFLSHVQASQTHGSQFLASFNHGSAQNIDIITQFICDTLTNSCGADQTAKNTCATAITASKAQTVKTGAQADGELVRQIVAIVFSLWPHNSLQCCVRHHHGLRCCSGPE